MISSSRGVNILTIALMTVLHRQLARAWFAECVGILLRGDDGEIGKTPVWTLVYSGAPQITRDSLDHKSRA